MKVLLSWQNCMVGGLERWMVDLAQVYQKLGHRCELFFFKRGPFEHHIPNNVRAHFGDLSDCLRLVKSERFEVVHAANVDWELGISAVRSLGAKLILTAHGWVCPHWNSTNCDALVGCSEWN